MTVTAPSIPASKTTRMPMSAPCTPVSSRMEGIHMSTAGGSRAKEEKIFVTVRVRPLSKKEIVLKDLVAWEYVDDHTIMFKTSQERSTSLHTCDKVYGPSSETETVFVGAAKDVALSALTGINAIILAYGQTSSGKTYTMRGITESAVNGIYKHINNTPEEGLYNQDICNGNL